MDEEKTCTAFRGFHSTTMRLSLAAAQIELNPCSNSCNGVLCICFWKVGLSQGVPKISFLIKWPQQYARVYVCVFLRGWWPSLWPAAIVVVCFHSKLYPRVTGFAPYFTLAWPGHHLSLTLCSMSTFLQWFSVCLFLFTFPLVTSFPSIFPCPFSSVLLKAPLWASRHMSRQAHVHACTHSLNQHEWLHTGLDSCYKKSHPLNPAVLSLYHRQLTAQTALWLLSPPFFRFPIFPLLAFVMCPFREQSGRKVWDRVWVKGWLWIERWGQAPWQWRIPDCCGAEASGCRPAKVLVYVCGPE